MNINLSLSPATGIPANYLVVAVYEASSPGVVVSFQSFAAPHNASVNVSFVNVNPVVHIVKVFENAAAAVGGTIRHQFIYNPWFTNAQVRMDLWLTADATPGFSSAGLSYTDASLKDWQFDLERRGFGTLEPAVDYSWDNVLTKWTLLATVDTPQPQIQPGEKFILHFQPKITVSFVPQPSGGLTLFNEVLEINVDHALVAADMGKAILIKGTNPYLELTLPDITTVNANRPIIITSQGGNHITAAIKTFSGAQKIDWLSGNLTEIDICQSEQIWFYKWVDPNDVNNYNWKVLNPDGHFKMVGELVESYLITPKNCRHADGSLLNRNSYKRLWNWVQSLDGSMLISDANWTNAALNNKGRFSTGDGVNTFRIPQIYADGFTRAVDGVARKASSHADAVLMDHRHEQTVGKLPASIFGSGTANRLIGDYSRQANHQGDLTSSPTKTDGTAFNTPPGVENNPANIGVYKLFRF